MLFSLEARRAESALSGEGKLVYDACENDFPRLTFYESAQAFRVDMAPLPELPYCASLIADKSFRSAKLSIWGSPKFSIDNAMMLLYAFASAPYAALEMHASVIAHEGRGYLFLAKSGTGKSTQSRMWLRCIEGAKLLNDDNPIVRIMPDGSVLVFGSPWSGKTPCYRNESYPVGAFVRIRRCSENRMTRLGVIEAYASLYSSCSGFKPDARMGDALHRSIEVAVSKVPCFVLDCLPDEDAARVCCRAVKEAQL